MKSDVELLLEQLKELVPEDLMEQDQVSSRADDPAPVVDSGDDTEGMETRRTTARGWPQIPLPLVMQQPQGMARWPSGLGPTTVAGTRIGLVVVPEAPLTRKRGGRGTHTKRRAKRHRRRGMQNQVNNCGMCTDS